MAVEVDVILPSLAAVVWPAFIPLLLTLYPTGRPASRRWWSAVWASVALALLWLLAQLAFQAERFQDAAGVLERLVYLGRSGTYDRSAAFDPGLMGESALLNLGHCYLRLGDAVPFIGRAIQHVVEAALIHRAGAAMILE